MLVLSGCTTKKAATGALQGPAAVPIADPTKRKKKLNLMNDEIPSLLKPIGYEPEYVQMIKLGEDHYVKPFDGMKLQN